MKIVNPLYDYAFKYLMQNDRIAKKVLSTLLECEVLELHLEQQEMVVIDTYRSLTLYRLDFSALIVNQAGEKQKVLIELQKSKLPTNSLRFRTYLGNSYTKKEVIKKENGEEITVAYPIIAIYILGYNLIDIPYLAVSINNQVTNTITNEVLDLKSDFMDLITHKTRIIQVRRLSDERKTRLEKFLMLFNQRWRTGEDYILDLKEVPNEFEDIAAYLEGPVQDEAFRIQLQGEEELDNIFKQTEADLKLARQEKEEAYREKEEAYREKEEAYREKEEAKQREKEAKINFAKFLLQMNKPVSEIAQLTALTEEQIKNINL